MCVWGGVNRDVFPLLEKCNMKAAFLLQSSG